MEAAQCPWPVVGQCTASPVGPETAPVRTVARRGRRVLRMLTAAAKTVLLPESAVEQHSGHVLFTFLPPKVYFLFLHFFSIVEAF